MNSALQSTLLLDPLQVYPEPLASFASDTVPGPVFTVPVVEQGRAALEAIDKVRCVSVHNHPALIEPACSICASVLHVAETLLSVQELGLAFDNWDLDYYTDMFQTQLRRDPTNVELFDIAQSNSEHSRHWFFKADLWLDGKKAQHSLFDLVKAPLKVQPRASLSSW